MAQNPSLDYYKLKVFLYKYTPVFTRGVSASPIQPFVRAADGSIVPGQVVPESGSNTVQDQSRLSKVDRYSVELDETKYFRKFDITEFVSSYTFSQDINDNTFSWSVVLQNTIIPFSQLNDRIKVEGPRIDTAALNTLAQYEAQARDGFDTDFINKAKTARGKTEDAMTARAGVISKVSLIANKNGIRLEDLIQPYDVISVFLYKGTTPLEELRGRKTKAVSVSGPVVFAIDPTGTYKLTEADLRTETILMSPTDHTDADATLFSNEFNGFVMAKAATSTVDAVDVLNIAGNGITRLFGATRKLLKSSVLQKSIYDLGDETNPMVFTSFQNTYSDKRVHEIFLDLFNLVYKIKPDSDRRVVQRTAIVNGREIAVTETNTASLGTFPKTENIAVPNSSFYDISGLQVANSLQTNLFTLPPFLLALVMKRHGYRYRQPKTGQLSTLVSQANAERRRPTIVLSKFTFGPNGGQPLGPSDVKNGPTPLLNQTAVDTVLDESSGLQTKTGVKSPIFMSDDLNTLRPYFRFVEEVLRFFTPELKTPFEIIDEIKAKTFLEFFERPDGTIVIRTPEYNNTTNTIFSSTLDVISTSYAENVAGLVTRQNVAYSVDLIPEILPLKMFAYTNGKLFLQYGFIEASADANPNAKNDKVKNTPITQKRDSGLIRYAEYLLRLSNAGLKTGSIVCGYDQRLTVGKTFFDEKNNKFGYIVGVSKTVNTGAGSTVTINLSYVRDAYAGAKINNQTVLQFEPLDRLVNVAQEFTTLSLDKSASDPTPDEPLTPLSGA